MLSCRMRSFSSALFFPDSDDVCDSPYVSALRLTPTPRGVFGFSASW